MRGKFLLCLQINHILVVVHLMPRHVPIRNLNFLTNLDVLPLTCVTTWVQFWISHCWRAGILRGLMMISGVSFCSIIKYCRIKLETREIPQSVAEHFARTDREIRIWNAHCCKEILRVTERENEGKIRIFYYEIEIYCRCQVNEKTTWGVPARFRKRNRRCVPKSLSRKSRNSWGKCYQVLLR